MQQAAAALALLVAVVDGAACLWGAWCWYRVRSSRVFWPLLRAGQAVAVVQAVGAGVLAVGGFRPSTLYWIYALVPVAVSFIAEQFRIASAETVLTARGLESAREVGTLPAADQRSLALAIIRRETGVMTLAALAICFLALRALATG